MGLVGDPESAAGVDQSKRRPDRAGHPAGGRHGRRHVLDQTGRVEDVRRAEGVQPEQLEVRRGSRAARGGRQVGGVHPELAGAVVADEPDPFQPVALGDGGAQHDRLAATRRSRGDRSSLASSPGDSTVIARMPAATAARSSSSRLPGPVITTRSGAEAGPGDGLQLAGRGDVGTEPKTPQVRHDRQRRVGLDRVGQLDDGGQHRPQGRHLAVDDVEVVDIQRRPEPPGELVGRQPAQPPRAKDLVARGRPPAPGTIHLGDRSSEHRLERHAGRRPGVAVLDQERHRHGQAVRLGEWPGHGPRCPAR